MRFLSTNKILVSAMLVVLPFASIFAQQDSTATNRQNEDSMQVVVPQSVYADIRMMTPPAGFIVSTGFNGYINYQTSSAIQMTFIENAIFVKITEGMNEDFYKQNKLNYISDSTFVSQYGVKGHLYKLWFVLEGHTYIRYMVYAGDLKNTLWINITYPKMVEELVEDELIKSINTINLNPSVDEK